MTERDAETGLPLFGSSKQVPIDPVLLPELREKIALAQQYGDEATRFAAQLVKTLAMGASIGARLGNADNDANQFALKVFAIHNVTPEQVNTEEPFDLEKGFINVR